MKPFQRYTIKQTNKEYTISEEQPLPEVELGIFYGYKKSNLFSSCNAKDLWFLFQIYISSPWLQKYGPIEDIAKQEDFKG